MHLKCTEIVIFEGDYIENLKNKIQMEQLTHITLLSPETAKHLQVPMIMMIMIMMMMIMMPMSMITIMLTTILMMMMIMMLMMIIKIIVIKSSFCVHRTWLSPRSRT